MFFNKKGLKNANVKEVVTDCTKEVVTHWISQTPHTIVASVILKNDKITQWKTGQFSLKDRINIQGLIKLHPEFSYQEKKWVAYNSLDHERIFDEESREWFKQWELNEDYNGMSPYKDEFLECLVKAVTNKIKE